MAEPGSLLNPEIQGSTLLGAHQDSTVSSVPPSPEGSLLTMPPSAENLMTTSIKIVEIAQVSPLNKRLF